PVVFYLLTSRCLMSRLPYSLSTTLLFFFLSPRQPPTSTLFPYTTLFRSRMPPRGERRMVGSIATARIVANADAEPVFSRIYMERDRKSTRLNSSHVSISYAVFCLKKKKKTKRPKREQS